MHSHGFFMFSAWAVMESAKRISLPEIWWEKQGEFLVLHPKCFKLRESLGLKMSKISSLVVEDQWANDVLACSTGLLHRNVTVAHVEHRHFWEHYRWSQEDLLTTLCEGCRFVFLRCSLPCKSDLFRERKRWGSVTWLPLLFSNLSNRLWPKPVEKRSAVFL